MLSYNGDIDGGLHPGYERYHGFETVEDQLLSGTASNPPTEGQLIITGDSGFNITVTIIGDDIQMDVDSDNDGQSNGVNTIDWDSIEAALAD